MLNFQGVYKQSGFSSQTWSQEGLIGHEFFLFFPILVDLFTFVSLKVMGVVFSVKR